MGSPVAITCPSCGVSRETGLCGYASGSFVERILGDEREVACRVCGYVGSIDEVHDVSLSVSLDPTSRAIPRSDLTMDEVREKARSLLLADGAAEEAIARMTLVER
jgi:hypothetical protein